VKSGKAGMPFGIISRMFHRPCSKPFWSIHSQNIQGTGEIGSEKVMERKKEAIGVANGLGMGQRS